MTAEALRFINDVVKPWEILNRQLGEPYAMSPEVSDFTNRASSLAISIKHLPEFTKKLVAKNLIPESRQYELISDLADSSKHGELRLTERECNLTLGSMFERNDDGKVRFLRNVINIHHNTYGKLDFMSCTMEAALFISKKLDIKTSWSPR